MTILSVLASSYSAGGLGGDWSSPTNAYDDNGVYATRAGTTKNTWYGTLFGFDLSSLPDDAVINSITLEAQWHNSANDTAGPVLHLGAQSGGSEIGAGTDDTTGQTGDELVQYSPTGLTTVDLKATGANGFWAILNFRRTDNTAHTASCDYVKITIDYSPAPKVLMGNTGVFTLTGNAARVLRSYKTFAAEGSYVWTRNDAFLAIGGGVQAYILQATTGAFTLSGQNAWLLRRLRILAAAGGYTFSGQNARLVARRVINGGVGSFLYNGANTILLRRYLLIAAAGNYAWGRQNAIELWLHQLRGAAGSYIWTGLDGILQKVVVGQYKLNGLTGVFTLTRNDARLLTHRKVIGFVGNFVWMRNNGILARGFVIRGSASGFVLSGQLAKLYYNRGIACGAGEFALTGNPARLLAFRKLFAEAGPFTLTGKNVILLLIGSVTIGRASAYDVRRMKATATDSIRMKAVAKDKLHGQ